MKKTTFLLFMVLIVSAITFSCSSDDDNTIEDEDITQTDYKITFQNWQSPITRVDLELLDANGNVIDYQTYTDVVSIHPNQIDAITYNITEGTHLRVTVSDVDNSQTGGGNQFFNLYWKLKNNLTGEIYDDSSISGEWYKQVVIELANPSGL